MRKRHSSYVVGIVLTVICVTSTIHARNKIKSNFLDAYPNADGTVLTSVPSNVEHCGICHYSFDGGGPKNPYGEAVAATDQSTAAILGLGSLDSDLDGFSNDVEITDTINFSNTPTFPGLKPANIGNVDIATVDVADILNNLIPSTGSDTTPPVVTVIAPNGPFNADRQYCNYRSMDSHRPRRQWCRLN